MWKPRTSWKPPSRPSARRPWKASASGTNSSATEPSSPSSWAPSSSSSAYVKPDWYLLWSLGPIFLAKWPIPSFGIPFLPDPLIDTKFLGTILVNVAFVAIMLIPFVAKGKAMRPVESPANAAMGVFGLAFIWWMSIVGIADILFAYEVQVDGPLRMNWLFESGLVTDPAVLIDWLGILTLHQTLLCTWLTYWALKRHRPKYESKLNATYYKVR
jgi:quinol-cytochrome oxidoreductase complex cytochrome b subunit